MLICYVAERRVKVFRWRVNEEDWKMSEETLPLIFAESQTSTNPSGCCGKMCREYSPAKITLSGAFLRNSRGLMQPSSQSEEGGQVRVWLLEKRELSRGVCSMLNMYEWTVTLEPFPNADGVCSLSDVLEQAEIPRRYFLSQKACTGILRRAAKRGKVLPKMLERALQEVATGTMTETPIRV
jgi:hypothetical protein